MTRSPQLLLPHVLVAATVLLQVAYPLAPDRWLTGLTVATVLTFASASVTHAAAVHGWGWAVRLTVLAVGLAFAVEAIGCSTGLPFGRYHYTATLGPELLGVPLLVPLAWLMMAYPCLVMARVLASRLPSKPAWPRSKAVAAVGALALAGWDVFLDPQMVAAGHWVWRHPSPGLPGIARVPLTNAAGWLVAGAVVMAVLHALLPSPQERAGERQPTATGPAVLLAWTWMGGVIGNLAFFGRPWVALWGGLALGLVVLPYLRVVVVAGRGPLSPEPSR